MRQNFYDLTNPQKNIWTLEQFYNGTDINNICGTLIIKQNTDLDILNKAINIFIKNNKSFGLNFKNDNGNLIQYFTKQEEENFERISLKDYKDVQKLGLEVANQVFNIGDKKLYKFILYKLENGYGGFIVLNHHIISDAATFGLIGTEIAEIYSKLLKNEEITEKDYSYENYIFDEKEYINSSKYFKDKEYWNSIYSTIPEVASVPSSKSNVTISSGLSKRKEFIIDKNLLNKIAEFCQKNKVSNFNFFMAVYAIYIGRVSNLDDFSIGTPILNRTNFKEKHTTGMFINTAALRIKIDKEMNFVQFVKQLAQDSFSMLRFQKYPYENLLQDLRKKQKDLGALYDVMLSYQITKANDKNIDIPYNVEWFPNSTISNGMYIHLHDNNDAGNLNIAYDYQIEIYNEIDITNMHNRILHIINQVLENENCIEKDIEIVTPEEKHKILYDFNKYEEAPNNDTFVSIFEKQVEKYPNNIALICDNKSLTYLELNQKANSLAHYLIKNDVKQNDIIAIMTDRSLETIVCMLAILKAGAAFVNMDPTYPIERTSYYLSDCKAKYLLKQKHLDLPIDNFKNIFEIDLDNKEIYGKNIENPNINIDLESLSYIIYTSGSTGTPKGVMLNHIGLANMCKAMTRVLDYLKDATNHSLLSVTSTPFDIFVYEIVVPLSHGMKIVLANNSEHRNPKLIDKLIRKYNVDVMTVTPSLMKINYDNREPNSALANVKNMVFGGEPLSEKFVQNLKELSSDITIYNIYGPSEITVLCNVQNLDGEKEINIGPPILNNKIYILDENMNIVPMGFTGEIYIGGIQVGCGYLGQEELTNQKFIKNPFDKGRMFKSGDIGKWTQDGKLQCCGRIDHQVKLKGLRIELGEIEKILESFSQVSQAVVNKTTVNEKEVLCAYYVLNSDIDENILKNALKEKLPHYMVPTYYMKLEKMPYSINRKIDRKALPTPKLETSSKNTSARNELDLKLIDIYKELLNLESVDIKESLYDLGGDSLTAITLSSIIYKKLGLNINVRDIFKYSSVTELSDFIANSNNKQTNIIKPIEKMDFYPISSAQKRIYSVSTMDDNSILYNVSGGIILDKNLDISLLENCFKKLIDRHESLRTRFDIIDNKIVQIIEDKIDFTLSSEIASSDNLDSIYKNFVKPFDLKEAPLFRAKIVNLKNDKMMLLLDTHHIISDGTSLNILLQELCDLYNGNTLSEKNIDYKDFTLWEKEQFETDEFKNSKDFWVNQYKDEIPLLNMPTSYPRPSIQSFEGANYCTKLEKDTFDKINNLAKKLGITPYMLMLSVYYILISKYTSEDTIVIGTPVINRNLPELSNILGMFVNTLALKNKIDNQETFKDFTNRVKDYCLSAFKNQNYPFDELVKELNIKRDTSRNPLFDVVFTYQNNGYPSIVFDNIQTEYFIPNNNISKFDLSLEVTPREDKFDLRFEYCTKLFDETFINRFASHYNNILNTILENSDIQISDIDIITEQEKNQILNDFNNTYMDYPRDKTIVYIFEEQVKKVPNNIATVFEDKQLTYLELNEKANQLANILKSKNINIGDIVGIYLNKSLEMVISMLAILKVGAAFLPLDIDYPKERLDYIINNSNPKAILSSEKIDAKVNIPIINVDLSEDIYKTTNIDNLNLKITPEDIMYVMYTSGSTGNPKGVMVKHKNIIRLAAFPNFIEFSENEVMVQTGTMVFDACIFEIFGALLHGFKLHILKKENILDVQYFTNFLEKEKVTILFLTTGLFNELSLHNPNMFNNLKYLLTGGDVISKTSVAEILKCHPTLKLINCYGPTENGSYSTCYQIIGNENVIPIGKPITNSTAYVVSPFGKLLPIGVPGELWVGGYGVGKGYINQDDLTKEKFIQNPFGEGKIYKTGDLVKWLPDGNIEFMGRIDNQVKIRGFRIELDEINRKILSIPNIKQAITLVHNINNTKMICSYIVSNLNIDTITLKNILAKHLPSYMIPTFIVQIKDLPLNINGKVDTKALPIPNIDDIERNIIFSRNNIDKLIINILSEILNINNISIDDSFFDLGGDSLSAIIFANTLTSKLQVPINVKNIFEYPTIMELSDYISGLNKEQNKTIKPVSKMDFYPTSSAQKRMFYASSIDTNSILYNISGGIILDKILDVSLLENCFKKLIDRHEALRTRFDVIDSQIVQIIEDKINFTLSNEIASSDDLDNIYKDFVKPFDLKKAPLFRAKTITLKNKKMLLLIDMHHIISDGTSLNILLQELCTLYNGNVLPEKNIDYKDFTLWEKDQFETDEFKISKDFWVNQYKDEIPLLNMPTSFPRPSVQSFEGANYCTKLEKDTFDKINNLARELEITPYMLMLSVYYVLLSKYTLGDTIVVGTPIINRDLSELSNLLGMFVNTLALRNKVNNDDNFSSFAKNVKDYCLSAFKNQNYPFDELVRELKVKRDTSRNPLFDVMFIYQNNGYPSINFDDVSAEYFVPSNNVSKFDLSLEVIPSQNEFNLRFEYCTKLFSEDFIRKFASHYNNILYTILENSDIKISDIDMLSEQEKNQILFDFNNTKTEYSSNKSIIDLFEKQVEKTPDNIALVFENQKLTYRELNEKANSLARYLIENNVSNNSIVGIMLPRSLEMIIGILGILKSGAAYLPIDPSYPKNRINYIIKDSNIKLLLIKDNDTVFKNIDTVDISLNENKIYKYDNSNLNIRISPDDLAYVIYTSGSTGNPKGVKITHKNVNNFIKGVTSKIKFSGIIISVTTICFDIFVLESILPLQKGLTIVIANESEQTIPELLNKLCIKNNVNMIQTTPSKFSLLTNDENSLEFLKNMKTIMLGGEAFQYNLLLKIKNLTKSKIYNMYGPTETTVWSSIKDLSISNEITIGTPIANTYMYVLDNNLNLLPCNIPGKLYIGGDGISNGYLNRQELTDSRFITNPYNTNEKIYDTGDLAKWTNNGELICLGRSDFQVKIRGLRIELGEIENAILSFKDIEKVVVSTNTDSLNRQLLCAYFIAQNRISISELKQYLGMFLPNYMVPTYITQITDFKYTPNGKIDTKALPEPKFINERKNIRLPKTNTEFRLIKIWEDLLCISPISTSDNFFDIGGDSLLAIKMQMELLKQDINITYGEIFKYNTIHRLSSLIDKKINVEYDDCPNLFDLYDYYNIDNLLKKNNISNINNSYYNPIGNVLLTGVTGFLGAHILDYLIKNTNARVFCLVRKDPSTSLVNKVLNKLHYYFGDKYDNLINKRIIIINSDLSKDNLGLTKNKLLTVSSQISCVINSAAIVKHYGNYEDFEKINVVGVKKLVNFCEKYHKKLIQISTLSVSGNTIFDLAINKQSFDKSIAFDETNLYIGQSLENVYVRSKFEAEKIILNEIYRNKLDALILRIGNITNRMSDGKFQINSNENAFANRLKAFMEILALPEYIMDKYIEFSPVDCVAEAIIKSISNTNKDISVLHIYNSNHVYLNDFIKLLPKKYTVDIVSDKKFQDIVNNMLKNNEKKYIISNILNDLNSEHKLVYETPIKIKSEFSQKFLKNAGFSWPIITKKYIENLLKNI